MNYHIPSKTPRLRTGAIAFVAFSMISARGQITQPAPNYVVSERGMDYRVWQKTVPITNALTGQVTQQIQSYRELGNGLCYQSADSSWVDSQDLVEATSIGAQAVHGPMPAFFNTDITASNAISLLPPSVANTAAPIQSSPIGLFYYDPSVDKVARIGLVQSGRAILHPPNVVVYQDVIPGLADLMVVWTKGGCEESLVIKRSPPTPQSYGLTSAARLQYWSAFQCPDPKEQRPVSLPSGLTDHIIIFDSCWLPVGGVFAFGTAPLPPTGQPAQIHLIDPSNPASICLAKSLVTVAGQKILIEEVNYSDLIPTLKTLPQASWFPKGEKAVELANRGDPLARPPTEAHPARAMQIASRPYEARGIVLDPPILLSENVNNYTFNGGATYYIQTSFMVGPGTATFGSSACIKFGPNAWLMTYGPVSFPSPTAGPPVVFTSKDDNFYGMIVDGSTANPQYSASQALWMYYPTFSTTVQNALFRWASRAIEYDENAADQYGHTLSSSVFQDCNTGVYMNMQSDTLTLSSDSYCNVVTPVQTDVYHGTVSGSMTYDCGVVSVAMVNNPVNDSIGLDPSKNSQSECSFVLADSSTVVAAFMNTHLSEYELGNVAFPGIPSPRMACWATSSDSGTTFTDQGPIPPVSTTIIGGVAVPIGASDPGHGDAGDPVMARETNGTFYLLVNPSRESDTWGGFRLWASTTKGSRFRGVNMNVPGGVNQADKPMIKAYGSDLYVTGFSFNSQGIWAAHSTNGGTFWDSYQLLEGIPPGQAVNGSDIVIATNGTVYVFWLRGQGYDPDHVTFGFRYAWLPRGSTTWNGPLSFGPTLVTLGYGPQGSGHLHRSTPRTDGDYFESNAWPRPAFANGRVYVVYTSSSTSDRGDIWLQEGTVNADGSLSFSLQRKVNNDSTTTDQWNPSITVNPAQTELFIGYYSRQNDPNNSLIMAYGAKASISGGLANATFDCFPVSPTMFPPLFAGTGSVYDPVWPQSNVCLDSDARYQAAPPPSCEWTTGSSYIHFCADDYTWVDADSSYFYFTWCDRTRMFGTRPDADVMFARIRQ